MKGEHIMPDTKKQSSLMSVLTICAIFIALLSFLLPYVSINFFGTHTMSGIDFIIEAIDDEEMPALLAVICPVLSVTGLIFAFTSMKSSKASVGTIISSGIGMIVMIVAMSDGDWDIIVALDYAAIGFYLYEVMSFAAVVLPAVSMYMSKNTVSGEVNRTPTPAPKPTPKPVPPVPGPIPAKKVICPKCKTEQEKDAAFCRFCGTPINNSKPIPPKPTPAPEPGPNPVPTPTPIAKAKDGKVMCPHCGARHMMGTTNCKYCGTAIVGTSHAKADPVVVEDPIPAPVYKPISTSKAGRKAVCPHCGARQSEDAINCKYCGTAMK